jgi:chromosome segregation ATPase
MKTHKIILALSLAGILWSCDSKEKMQLLSKVDSLQVELNTSLQTAQTLQEIGTLIDAIDESRQVLRTNVVEGTSYADYKNRLAETNIYIQETRLKIEELENSLQKSGANYSATIKRLKADLELNSAQLIALQQEVTKMRGENEMLTTTVSERDATLAAQHETIQMKEQDIASLEAKVQEINTTSTNSQAEMFYAQAVALETAAERTKFAPRKKKETQREALELYRQSLSLGNQEAQSRIEELEKVLS